MIEYRVAVVRSARKELEKLPRPVAERVIASLERLRAQPRPAAARKLQGAADLWRIRVGHYRVVYAIDDVHHTIDVRVVRHRKDAYR